MLASISPIKRVGGRAPDRTEFFLVDGYSGTTSLRYVARSSEGSRICIRLNQLLARCCSGDLAIIEWIADAALVSGKPIDMCRAREKCL